MPEVPTGEIAYLLESLAASTGGKLALCTAIWFGFVKVLFHTH